MAWVKSRYQQEEELQQKAADAQAKAHARAASAAQAWHIMASSPTVTQQEYKLPINWQHSADTGAERAGKLELQDLKNRGELQQLAMHNAMAKDIEEWRIRMRAKYAPKGGVSPIAKTVEKIGRAHV